MVRHRWKTTCSFQAGFGPFLCQCACVGTRAFVWSQRRAHNCTNWKWWNHPGRENWGRFNLAARERFCFFLKPLLHLFCSAQFIQEKPFLLLLLLACICVPSLDRQVSFCSSRLHRLSPCSSRDLLCQCSTILALPTKKEIPADPIWRQVLEKAVNRQVTPV